MPQDEHVYTINETDEGILESMRRQLDSRRSVRSASAPEAAAASRPGRSASRVQYAQPPIKGTAALRASTLSLLLCGGGQAYNGQGKLATLLLLTEAFFLSANWSVSHLWWDLKEFVGLFGVAEWRMALTVAAADFLMVFVLLGAIVQAYRRAEAEHGRFDGLGNPVLSGLASLLVPGWGQLVNGQAGKAAAFLFWFLAGLYTLGLMIFTPLPRLIREVEAASGLVDRATLGAAGILGTAAVMWILSVYDAILVAGWRRRMA